MAPVLPIEAVDVDVPAEARRARAALISVAPALAGGSEDSLRRLADAAMASAGEWAAPIDRLAYSEVARTALSALILRRPDEVALRAASMRFAEAALDLGLYGAAIAAAADVARSSEPVDGRGLTTAALSAYRGTEFLRRLGTAAEHQATDGGPAAGLWYVAATAFAAIPGAAEAQSLLAGLGNTLSKCGPDLPRLQLAYDVLTLRPAVRQVGGLTNTTDALLRVAEHALDRGGAVWWTVPASVRDQSTTLAESAVVAAVSDARAPAVLEVRRRAHRIVASVERPASSVSRLRAAADFTGLPPSAASGLGLIPRVPVTPDVPGTTAASGPSSARRSVGPDGLGMGDP